MNNRVALRLGDRALIYCVVDLPPEVEMHDYNCQQCGGHLDHIASISQLGFWEDTHVCFTVCRRCAKPVAYRQIFPLSWEVNNNVNR